MKCHLCGKKAKDNMEMCPHCGTYLAGDEVRTFKAEDLQKVQPVEEKSVPKSTGNIGAAIGIGLFFTLWCGGVLAGLIVTIFAKVWAGTVVTSIMFSVGLGFGIFVVRNALKGEVVSSVKKTAAEIIAEIQEENKRHEEIHATLTVKSYGNDKEILFDDISASTENPELTTEEVEARMDNLPTTFDVYFYDEDDINGFEFHLRDVLAVDYVLVRKDAEHEDI